MTLSDDDLRAVIEAGEKAGAKPFVVGANISPDGWPVFRLRDMESLDAHTISNYAVYLALAANAADAMARELLELREKAAKMEKDNADLRRRLALLTEKRANDFLSEWW